MDCYFGIAKIRKGILLLATYLLPLSVVLAQDWSKGKRLYRDNFKGELKNWVIETPSAPGSKVLSVNNKLMINVKGGATVWLKQKLSGNILIEYTQRVILQGGPNDRLSDLNQFWMASDPKNPNLFTRSGAFPEYDNLLLYYVGFGGNNNTTTRFRKYDGTGNRVLHQDLTDPAHLLQPNKEYKIRIVVFNGRTSFAVNGEEYFSYQDPEPLREGYFGFRTVHSHQEIYDFHIYRLK